MMYLLCTFRVVLFVGLLLGTVSTEAWAVA